MPIFLFRLNSVKWQNIGYEQVHNYLIFGNLGHATSSRYASISNFNGLLACFLGRGEWKYWRATATVQIKRKPSFELLTGWTGLTSSSWTSFDVLLAYVEVCHVVLIWHSFQLKINFSLSLYSSPRVQVKYS